MQSVFITTEVLRVRTPFMARCTRYNIMSYSLSVTCDRSVVFSGHSGFLHQLVSTTYLQFTFLHIIMISKWHVNVLIQRIPYIVVYLIYMARVMVFNATFNNILVISWRSVLLVEKTRVPGENHRSVASHWQTIWHNVVSSTSRHEWGSNSHPCHINEIHYYIWYPLDEHIHMSFRYHNNM
jgi:hypothetical protein